MKNLESLKKIKKAQKIIKILKKQGFEAFIVGGAVRDYLLNIKIDQDIDITTNALSQDINVIFQSKNYAHYGSVKIIFEEENFEITTYREEGVYFNNRHPSEIFFIQEAQKDIIRRDFTINALLMDEKGQIFDFTTGKLDLEQKILRTISNPFISFYKDALRIMRAFYFQAKLNIKIEHQTKKALKTQSHLLTKISYQRIYEYLQKIITYPNWQNSFKTIINTKTHLYLKAITRSIIFFASLDIITIKTLKIERYLEENIFWSISLAFDKNIFLFWPINAKNKNKYQTLIILSNNIFEDLKFNLFKYGLQNCLLSYKINYLLSHQKSKHLFSQNLNNIQKTYKNLPLKDIKDLKICWKEILPKIINPLHPPIKEIKKKLLQAVLNQKIPNQKEVLMEFVLNQKY
ncbi:CCA tRNA nucleotidyltransferase [Candidatus Phytoplasma solani]|uniref:poly(A) polymerase n=1 Tax=Candidatus Phytoplasma solani TaxID=69896 RepID=UPI0032DA7D2C